MFVRGRLWGDGVLSGPCVFKGFGGTEAYGEELAEKSLREGEAEPKLREKGRGETTRRKEGVALEWGGFWGWFFIFGGCVSEKDE